MEHQEAISNIKKSIAKGNTEKAIKQLMEYSEEINCPSHDEVVLLSGQFMKWKRENMLGIHQTSTELRRIELAIMEILDKRLGKMGKAPKKQEEVAASPPVVEQPVIPPVSQPKQAGTTVQAGTQKKRSMVPLVGGVVGVGIIIVAFMWFSGQEGDSTANDLATKATVSEQSVATDSSSSPAKVVQPTNNPTEEEKEDKTPPETQDQEDPTSGTGSSNLNGSSTTPKPSSTTTTPKRKLTIIRQGKSLEKGQEMYSSNGNYRLVLQKDGNLMLYDYNYRPLWATRTTTGHKLSLLPSGNLVLFDAGGNDVWSSKTSAAAKLTVENGGKIMLSNSQGEMVWSKP